MSIKPLEVELRIRNNALKARRKRLGLSQKRLAEIIGTSNCSIHQLENFRKHPRNKDGTWSKVCIMCSEFFGEDLETLFPVHLYETIKIATTSREVELEDVLPAIQTGNLELLGQGNETERQYDTQAARSVISETLAKLSEREAEMVSMYFGLEDGRPQMLTEIGLRFGLSRSRVDQIVKRALKRCHNRFELLGYRFDDLAADENPGFISRLEALGNET